MKRFLLLGILALFVSGGLIYAADAETGDKSGKVKEPELKMAGSEKTETSVGTGEGEQPAEGEAKTPAEGEGTTTKEGEVQKPAAAIEEIGQDQGAAGTPRVATAPPQPDVKWHILLSPPPKVSAPEVPSFSEEQPREEEYLTNFPTD